MRIIRASEIGEYLYCRRAWWLRHVQGLESANEPAMAEGTEAHAGHGRLVGAAAALRALALLLFVAALLVFLVTLFFR
jgi:CRISPR/Cas system-associated exonuclease Cas4 (RecB family)